VNDESSFRNGLALMRRGAFFEAHEELEVAWRAATAEERDFYQGLVHVAVAWYQSGRGRPVACASQLAKARRRLGPFAPSRRGVDVSALLRQLEQASELVARGSLDLPELRL
jgi:predicted metal-dependent hydrolase